MAKKKEGAEVVKKEVASEPINSLSVDYPTEALNNMARKINEIIDLLNA